LPAIVSIGILGGSKDGRIILSLPYIPQAVRVEIEVGTGAGDKAEYEREKANEGFHGGWLARPIRGGTLFRDETGVGAR
jgi:hypothetical protein